MGVIIWDQFSSREMVHIYPIVFSLIIGLILEMKTKLKEGPYLLMVKMQLLRVVNLLIIVRI